MLQQLLAMGGEGSGGARKGAGRKRQREQTPAPAPAPEHSNPFEAARVAARRRQEREDAAKAEAARAEEEDEQVVPLPDEDADQTNAAVQSLATAAVEEVAAPSAAAGGSNALAISSANTFASVISNALRTSTTSIMNYVTGIFRQERRETREAFADREKRLAEISEEVDEKLTSVKDAIKVSKGRRSIETHFAHQTSLCMTAGGTVFCSVCSENAHLIGDGRVTNSPFIMGSTRFKNSPLRVDHDDKQLGNAIRSHYGSENMPVSSLHERCERLAEESKRQRLLSELMSQRDAREHEIMGRLMLLACDLAKRHSSFHSYEGSLYLIELCGGDVGQREHSRKTAQSMVRVAAKVGLEQIKLFLTTTNPIMQHKPHVCVKADKMTDNDGVQFEIINIRLNVDGTPVTYNLGVIPMGEDDALLALDAPEAGGFACFNALLECLETVGVVLIENNESIFELKDFPSAGYGIAEQCRSSNFDGEATYNGDGTNSVKARFKDPESGYGDATHITGHDASHATDLLKEDGVKAVSGDYVLATVHVTICEIYSHFSRSPKRCRGLCRLADEWGVQLQQLAFLFTVRFVSSEVRVLRHFLEDLPCVVMYLRDELKTLKGDQKKKIATWLRTITQFRFVGTIITQLDIDIVLSKFSVAMQSDSFLCMYYNLELDRFLAEIRGLKTQLGQTATARLSELASGRVVSTLQKRTNELVLSEEDGVGAFQSTVELVGDKPISKLVVTLTGTPRGAAVKAQLFDLAKPSLDAIIANFARRLPTNNLYSDYYKLFGFDAMEFNSDSDAAYRALLVYGDDAVERLVKNYYPMLDEALVKDDFLKVKRWLWENWKRFYDEDAADPDWPKARREKHVPKPGLRIAGHDSIAHALFTTPNVTGCSIPRFLHIFDDMLSRSITSCDVERTGSQISLTKTLKRTSLNDDTFADLVFLASNLPHLHEIDTPLLVKAWKEAGHRLPLKKNDAESIVLSRLRARTSHAKGFFLKSGSNYKITDWSFLRHAADED